MYKNIKITNKRTKCCELITQAMLKRRRLAQSAISKVCDVNKLIRIVK